MPECQNANILKKSGRQPNNRSKNPCRLRSRTCVLPFFTPKPLPKMNNQEFSTIQQLAEQLNDAIANLPTIEAQELGDTLSEQVDLNLGDLQSLLSTTSDFLKSE